MRVPYLLHSQVPIVSEILSWISAYPSSINVKKVQYSLVSYPKEKAPKTPYVGKLFLEIEIQDPLEAKSFQDSLRQPGSLANPGKGFSWEAEGTSYKISFILQQKPELFP